MSSKRKGAKGKDASDPNVPLLKPTFSGKPAASKPTNSTWKEWEEEDEREDRVGRKTTDKQKRSRSAFFGFVRNSLAILLLVVVFSLQPFAIRPRAPGTNKVKVAPVPVLLAGAAHFGARAGVPPARINATLDTVGRALLFPNKYWTLWRDKRAPAADKSASAAWRKTRTALASALETTDKSLAANTMVYAGSALAVLGSLSAILVSGAEMLALVGALILFNGARTSGLEAQPELYVLAVIAALMLSCSEAVGKSGGAPKQRKSKRQ